MSRCPATGDPPTREHLLQGGSVALGRTGEFAMQRCGRDHPPHDEWREAHPGEEPVGVLAGRGNVAHDLFGATTVRVGRDRPHEGPSHPGATRLGEYEDLVDRDARALRESAHRRVREHGIPDGRPVGGREEAHEVRAPEGGPRVVEASSNPPAG